MPRKGLIAIKTQQLYKTRLSVVFWIYSVILLLCFNRVLACGGILYGREGDIKTPNRPKFYDNNLNCTWTVEVDESETITVAFSDFDVEESSLPNVECADYFYVFDGPDSTSPQLLKKPCGSTAPEHVYSSGNVLTMQFKSDSEGTRRGVHLIWRVSDKFMISSEPKTWHDANVECKKDGGHLAVNHEFSETLMLKQLGDSPGSIWTGEYLTSWVWLKGCYEVVNRQMMSEKHFHQSKENQAKICHHVCRDYVYFGLQEYRCICLTTEDMASLELVRSAWVCKTPCPGNHHEQCGGEDAFTVYMNDVCWTNSSSWKGKVSRTISGRRCQTWSSDTPHAHTFHGDHMFPDESEATASNYCRDPDGRGAPWCFTEDPYVPWQFCDVPPCANTCHFDPSKYTGKLNRTIWGFSCINWTDGEQTFRDPAKFPDATLEDAGNNCRSPDNDPTLWCYTDPDSFSRDYCGSPPCFGNDTGKDNGELCRIYWSQDSKVYSKPTSCAELQFYSCLTDHLVSFISADYLLNFNDAMEECQDSYSISDYRCLFGLLDKESLEKRNRRYWLGNFRFLDHMHDKVEVPNPSACKTVRRNGNELMTEIEANCSLEFRYICQTVAILCGEKFTTDNGSLVSPGYPEEYNNDENCLWEIEVSEGAKIRILFLSLDIEESKDCDFDFVEVLEAHNSQLDSVKKLCGGATNTSVLLDSNKAVVKFKTDKYTAYSGFHMEWVAEPTKRTPSTTLKPTTPTLPPSTKPRSTTAEVRTSTTTTADRISSTTTSEVPASGNDISHQYADNKNNSLGVPAIGAIAGGGVLGVGAVVTGVVVWIRRHRSVHL